MITFGKQIRVGSIERKTALLLSTMMHHRKRRKAIKDIWNNPNGQQKKSDKVNLWTNRSIEALLNYFAQIKICNFLAFPAGGEGAVAPLFLWYGAV